MTDPRGNQPRFSKVEHPDSLEKMHRSLSEKDRGKEKYFKEEQHFVRQSHAKVWLIQRHAKDLRHLDDEARDEAGGR